MEPAAANVFVEFPSELGGILTAGGAELIEEHRQGEPVKRSLLILDEEERSERLKSSASSSTADGGDAASKLLERCDAEYIKSIQLAKACLLSDEVMKQGFCVCADSATWTDASVLGEAARMRALMLELKGSDDAALRLRSAATLYVNECTLPGRYDLVPSPLPSGTSIALLETNLGPLGEPTKARVASDKRATEQAACIYKVNFAPKKWSLSDVLGLRMPNATDLRIAALMRALGVQSIQTFADLVVRHRKGPAGGGDAPSGGVMKPCARPCGGCVLTPQVFQRRFTMRTPELARRCIPSVNDKLSALQRIRLRSGLFLSAIDLSDVIVVVRTSRTAKGFEFVPFEDVMDEQELAALQVQLRVEKRLDAWREHMLSGAMSCMRAPERSSAESAVGWATSHLSAVRQDGSSAWSPALSSVTAGDVTAVFANVPSNVYCIVFGPRADDTFAADAQVQRDLCDDLAELGEMHERGVNIKRPREDDAQSQITADATRLVQAARIVDKSEGLRQLASVVVAMLTQSPLTFEEILSSSVLTPYRPDGASPVGDLRKAVRETLSRHAEYSGRKYHLRE